MEENLLENLFRSPADPVEKRISYFYRAEAVEGEAVVTSPFYRYRLVELVRASNGFQVADRAIDQSQVDSLLAQGDQLLKANDPSAEAVLEMVTRVAPDYALGHSRLGYAYLKVNQLDQALVSFERATSMNHRLAEAYNGIGLVFQEKPKGLYTAIHYFQKALRYDQNYVEARYNMALVRHQMEEHDVKHDIERILGIDPAFAPAFKLLGQWYELQQEDFEQAAIHYARYMALAPEDPGGRRLLANAYLRAENYDRIVDLLTEYIRQHPGEIPVLAVLAQACVKMGRLEWANQYFNQYLDTVDTDEATLYEDARLLMTNDEVDMYARTSGEDRKVFLNRFWSGHDPDLTTAINERRLEHYRRVWFVRQNFSGGKQPWDRRGEVYIRFGEPEYRSRSSMQNFDQSLKVQRVRERIARNLYGSAAQSMSFLGGPVYAVRSLKANLGASVSMTDGYANERLVEVIGSSGPQAAQGEEATVNGPRLTSGLTAEGELTGESLELLRSENVQMSGSGPMGDGFGGGSDYYSEFKPVTAQEDGSMVPWETWVYTDVNGGMEITFTDESMRGIFDYAPPPMDSRLPFQLLTRFNQYNPRRVAEQAALVTPDYYAPPGGIPPIEFYYDVAHFQSEQEGESLLEVYLGVPYGAGRYLADRDVTDIVVERSVAVLNESNGAVCRREGDLVFRSGGDLTQASGGFVPDVVSLSVPPGTYRLEVRMKDRLSGRQGRYRQDIVVNDFSRGGLRISELELAWRVKASEEPDKFTKGGLQVIPIPTRTFGGNQSVFVYYEIYNLELDEFDQTRYKVEYTIGPRDSSGRKAEGVISRLVRVFTSEKRQIAVGYEQLGDGRSEKTYMELDLSSTSSGKHWLKVEVTDLKTGQTTFRETSFEVIK